MHYNISNMAKPIKITPTLKGKDAVRFLKQIEENKSNPKDNARLEQIRKDASILNSLFKKV